MHSELQGGMKDVVRAAGLTGFRRLVTELGGDSGPILACAGLDDAMLANPDRYIPYRNVLLAFEEAARSLGVPNFGMQLAARQDMTFLGALALAIQSAESVRDGLFVAARNINYHTPSVSIDARRSDIPGLEYFEIRFMLKHAPEIPQATEHAVSHLCKLVRVLSNDSIVPDMIFFRHRQIGSEASYDEYLRTIPRFESAFDGIALKSSAIRQTLPKTNRQLQEFVERFLIGASSSTDLSLPEQVYEILRNLMKVQRPAIEDVSRVLRLQPRTLQRRLKERGIKFENIRDEVRQRETAELLAQPAVPLAVVAQTVGFNDQAALNRACIRWFGKTPRQHRKSLLDNPAP